MIMSWTSFFNLLGSFNGLFFAIIFFYLKRGNKRANRVLALVFINFAFISTGAFLSNTGLYKTYPHLMRLGSPWLFAMGPLLYFYIRYLVISDTEKGFKMGLHFLPVMLNYLYNLPFYFRSEAEKITFSLDAPHPDVLIFRVLCIIHFAVYLVLIYKDLKIYHRSLKEGYSSIEAKRLNWILYLSFSIFSILLTQFLFLSYVVFISPMFNIWETVVILVLAFKGFTHPAIFGDQEFVKQIIRSEKPVLTGERQQVYLQKILEQVEIKRVYLDSQLTLKKFSKDLGIPISYCSNVINSLIKKNFFDFINHYRINEAKIRLANMNKNESILDVAFQAGFNSKSTFNSVFKKEVKKTPSQFRKESKN